MESDRVVELIIAELKAAEKKHPGWPDDKIHAAAIMAEEAGEAVKASIDYEYAMTEDLESVALKEFIKETAQTGAMAMRILMNLPDDIR